MAEKREKSETQFKKEFAEQMWLHYFNQILFSQGIITEAERNRINNMISSRKLSPSAESL